ncbi:hypothetical protein E4U60_004431 [Claviceps pazoutovae]|uniref:HTH APSES-type domain-containing protein n=1 Tax=Claviceps pazoutovae TaxID=1649127 RepID=A0A9P7SFW0_9HYPO|nr:hypothetical protein E4U60_004431 [Claviceps pazoutovae]
MLSIAALLNPLEPGGNNTDQSLPGPSQHRFRISLHNSRSRCSEERPSLDGKRKEATSAAAAQGSVNFPPFENVNDEVVREIKRYGVPQFGSIHETREHIPYNSSKRDFSIKTGRESIEALKYTFQIPGETLVHTVLWDYRIGFVRVAPFFKSMGYTKTKPSKALDKNPGLRDVCPSITGGAVSAQGYWMPFHCARALCATFCHKISGALIPIFGPDFPSDCTLPESPRFGNMIISQRLIAEAVATAPSRERQPKGTVGGDVVQAGSSRTLEAWPSTPRPATIPTTSPLRLASHSRSRNSHISMPARERLWVVQNVNHHTISGDSTATSSTLETSDAAGKTQPDCERCEGPCNGAGPSNLCRSPSLKRIIGPQDTMNDECKRRKVACPLPLLNEGSERNTSGRTALPEGRGLATSRRRETEAIRNNLDRSTAASRQRVEAELEDGAEIYK